MIWLGSCLDLGLYPELVFSGLLNGKEEWRRLNLFQRVGWEKQGACFSRNQNSLKGRERCDSPSLQCSPIGIRDGVSYRNNEK